MGRMCYQISAFEREIVRTLPPFWCIDNYLCYFYFQERGEFNAIEGMVTEVKIDWDGFVCAFLYGSSVFTETFSHSASSLSDEL